MALPEQLADLERKVSARYSEALAAIRLEMRRAVQAESQRASSAMLAELEAIAPPRSAGLLAEEELQALASAAGGEARRDLARALRTVLVDLDRARTQNAVLLALLSGARPFGDHAALWLMRPLEIVGWASLGFASGAAPDRTDAADPVAGRAIAHEASPALARLASGRGCVLVTGGPAAQLANALEIAIPERALLVPLVLRDRVAAALYVDAATAGEFEVEALQTLTLAAAQRLELQALATRSYTPTLFFDEEAPASERGLPLWDPAARMAASASDSEGDGALPEEGEASSVADDSPPDLATEDRAEEPETAWLLSSSPAPVEALPGASATGAPVPTVDQFEIPDAAFELDRPVDSPPTRTASGDRDLAEPRPAPAREEIAWQMEAEDETAGVGSASAVAAEMVLPPVSEATSAESLPGVPEASWLTSTPTHEIPLAAPAPDLAAAERFADAAAAAANAAGEWRELEETTAPHSTVPPAATQRFSPPVVTNEFPQPSFSSTAPILPPLEPILTSSASTIAFIPPAAPREAPIAEEDATVMISRTVAEPAPAPPVAPPPAAIVQDDEPTISRGARSTEVAPPADLQGPGWAFSSVRAARSTGDNALHEEARRLARLLVSEIKLYNEDQVEEGRHNRDIYHRLKDDIDRSRQIYEERVHESVRSTTDYFQQELIRSLAGGDPRALGI